MSSEKSFEEKLAHSMKMYYEQIKIVKEKERMLNDVLNRRQELIDEIHKLNMALLVCQKDYESILADNTELMAEMELLQNQQNQQSQPNKSHKRKRRGGRRKRKKTLNKRKKKQKKSRRK